MNNKKDLIIAILVTFCLTATLFITLPTRSQVGIMQAGEYDPWIDLNDDGWINAKEAVLLGMIFDTNGDPVNKTALLYDVNNTFTQLLSRLDDMNSSLNLLQSRTDSQDIIITDLQTKIEGVNVSLVELASLVNTLESTISSLQLEMLALNTSSIECQTRLNTLNNTVVDLENQLDYLNATLNSRIDILQDKIGHPIQFNQTKITSYNTTESLNWNDVTNLSVQITLENASNLLIMLSAEAYTYVDITTNGQIYIRSLVDESTVYPSEVTFTPHIEDTGFFGLSTHHHRLLTGAYSYNFYAIAVSSGVHTVEIQMKVSSSTTGYLYNSTLTVIALPTS